MITMNWLELIGMLIGTAILACVVYDLVWTGLVSDTRAATHFQTASRRRRIMYLLLTIWAIYTIATSIMAFS